MNPREEVRASRRALINRDGSCNPPRSIIFLYAFSSHRANYSQIQRTRMLTRRAPISVIQARRCATLTSGLNVWSRRRTVRSFETSLRQFYFGSRKGTAPGRKEELRTLERTSVKESQDAHCRVPGTLCALLQTGFL